MVGQIRPLDHGGNEAEEQLPMLEGVGGAQISWETSGSLL